MMERPLTDKDLSKVHEVYDSYKRRTGVAWTAQQAAAVSSTLSLTYEYNRELARCMLQSIDNGPSHPFVSNEYLALRERLEKTGMARKTKLDDDKKQIVAAANRTVFIDEFGQRFAPPTRDEVLAGLKQLEIVKKNLDRFSAEFAKLARD